jgi:Lrp/AsnC family leucine-responsive transcriptional regulator
MHKLSPLDKSILEVLYQDARQPISEIAEKLQEPASTIRGRLKRLETTGIVSGYLPIIDPKKLGFDLTAVVMLRRDSGGHVNDVIPFLKDVPGIVHFQNPLGDVDGLLTIWAKNINSLSEVIRELNRIEGVIRTETLVILEEQRFLPPNILDLV